MIHLMFLLWSAAQVCCSVSAGLCTQVLWVVLLEVSLGTGWAADLVCYILGQCLGSLRRDSGVLRSFHIGDAL